MHDVLYCTSTNHKKLAHVEKFRDKLTNDEMVFVCFKLQDCGLDYSSFLLLNPYTITDVFGHNL